MVRPIFASEVDRFNALLRAHHWLGHRLTGQVMRYSAWGLPNRAPWCVFTRSSSRGLWSSGSMVAVAHRDANDDVGPAGRGTTGAVWPGTEFAEHTEHDRGHGRTEERILRTAPVTTAAPIDFPHTTQVSA